MRRVCEVEGIECVLRGFLGNICTNMQPERPPRPNPRPNPRRVSAPPADPIPGPDRRGDDDAGRADEAPRGRASALIDAVLRINASLDLATVLREAVSVLRSTD